MSAGVIAASYVDTLTPPVVQGSATTGASSSTATVNGVLPAGVAAGDRLHFAFFRNQGGTPSTPPAGWTLIANVATSLLRLWVYEKIAVAGEPNPVCIMSSASQYNSICTRSTGVGSVETVATNAEETLSTSSTGTTTTTGEDTLLVFCGAQRSTTGPGAITFDAAITPTSATVGVSTFYHMRAGYEVDSTPGTTVSRSIATSGGPNTHICSAVIPLKA